MTLTEQGRVLEARRAICRSFIGFTGVQPLSTQLMGLLNNGGRLRAVVWDGRTKSFETQAFKSSPLVILENPQWSTARACELTSEFSAGLN
jgi:hypothetical protein